MPEFLHHPGRAGWWPVGKNFCSFKRCAPRAPLVSMLDLHGFLFGVVQEFGHWRYTPPPNIEGRGERGAADPQKE